MTQRQQQLNKDYTLFQQDPCINGLDDLERINLGLDNPADFVYRPAKVGETVKCRLISFNRDYLFIVETNHGFNIPLLVTQVSKLSSTYLIKTYDTLYAQNEDGALAYLEKSLFSSSFILYDYNSSSQTTTQQSGVVDRTQLLRIDYESFMNNLGLPVKIKVYMPGLDDCQNQYEVKSFDSVVKSVKQTPPPTTTTQSDTVVEIENASLITTPQFFINKTANISIFNKPIVNLSTKTAMYDKSRKVYLLHMSDRVRLPSVLNFQLISEHNPNYIVLQCGRFDKEAFTCDYSYPLNALQAFSILLSRLHKTNIFSQ